MDHCNSVPLASYPLGGYSHSDEGFPKVLAIHNVFNGNLTTFRADKVTSFDGNEKKLCAQKYNKSSYDNYCEKMNNKCSPQEPCLQCSLEADKLLNALHARGIRKNGEKISSQTNTVRNNRLNPISGQTYPPLHPPELIDVRTVQSTDIQSRHPHQRKDITSFRPPLRDSIPSLPPHKRMDHIPSMPFQQKINNIQLTPPPLPFKQRGNDCSGGNIPPLHPSQQQDNRINNVASLPRLLTDHSIQRPKRPSPITNTQIDDRDSNTTVEMTNINCINNDNTDTNMDLNPPDSLSDVDFCNIGVHIPPVLQDDEDGLFINNTCENPPSVSSSMERDDLQNAETLQKNEEEKDDLENAGEELQNVEDEDSQCNNLEFYRGLLPSGIDRIKTEVKQSEDLDNASDVTNVPNKWDVDTAKTLQLLIQNAINANYPSISKLGDDIAKSIRNEIVSAMVSNVKNDLSSLLSTKIKEEPEDTDSLLPKTVSSPTLETCKKSQKIKTYKKNKYPKKLDGVDATLKEKHKVDLCKFRQMREKWKSILG